MDRSEVIAVGEKLATPAATFETVHMRDLSAIEKGGDGKWYAETLAW